MAPHGHRPRLEFLLNFFGGSKTMRCERHQMSIRQDLREFDLPAALAMALRFVFVKVIFVVVTFVAAAGSALAEDALTFSSLLQRAREASPNIVAAKTRIAISQAALAAAERAGLPTAQLSSTLSSRLEREGARSSEGSAKLKIGEAGAFSFEQNHLLGVTVPLYDGGRAKAQQQGAIARVEQANESVAELDHEIAQAVARLCSRYLAATSILAVAELQERSAATKFSDIQAAYRRGERSELDLTRAEFERARAVIVRDRANGERLLLDRALSDLIDLPSAPPKLNLKQQSPEGWQTLMSSIKSEPIRSPASAKRVREREALKAELELIAASDSWTVNAQAGAGAGGMLVPLRPLATAQLQLVWPLPWNRASGSERERLLLALRVVDEAEANDNRSRAEMALKAELAMELLRKEFEAQTNQLGVLQRYVKLMKRRYDAGRASALELGESEDQLLTVRLERERIQSQIADRVIDYADARGFADYAPFFDGRG
jgi:outer membrane protein TolC